jgi:hypothetical protein
MATRLYLRNTANGTTGLPTTKQSTRATVGNAQATTVNKNLSTTIGTSQQSILISIGSGYTYIGRWVSDVIGQSSIAANTWTFSFGYDSFWGSSDVGVQVNIFVWRPTTTTKIGTVADSSVAQAFNSTETGYKLTVTGSAVSSITSGTDVLCVEFMTNGSLAGGNANFYYDGTTAVTTNDTAASSVAAYIETPENVTIGIPPGVTATTTAKVVTNKFIAKG